MQRNRDVFVTTGIGAIVGLAAALALGVLLASPTGILLTGGCGFITVVRDSGFDPWTGQPRGQVTRSNCFDAQSEYTSPPPEEIAGRRGLPWATLIVAGFTLGGLGAGLAGKRRRVPASG